MMPIRKTQSGFTIIELLIATLIGLFVIGATIGIFTTAMGSNVATLNMIRLNQELQATMSLMSRDIRRTGYWANHTAGTVNPFEPRDGVLTSYIPGGTNWTDSNGVASTSRTFAYDANADGVDDGTAEEFGFQLNGTQVEMLDGANAWQPLTDPAVVNITGLAFTINVWCPGNSTCAAPVGSEIRTINIVLTGQLTNDATVSRTLTETIRIRNDVI